jgi:recombination protein RecA
MLTEDEAWKAIAKATKELNKKHDVDDSLVLMADKVGIPIPHLKTGLYTLDNDVFICGGVPKGRFIEMYGLESSGKTTMALHIVGCEQREGGRAAFIDMECALDPSYASSLGVDMEKLIISQPVTGEMALDVMDTLIDGGLVSMIVVDSIAAMVPSAEYKGEFGDANMGRHARLMGQACRILCGKAYRNNVTIIWINQVRLKLTSYGDPTTTTGGNAMKFYASVRLHIRRPKPDLGPKETPIGQQIKIEAEKNKAGKGEGNTIINLYWDSGLDLVADFLTYAKNIGVIEQKGAFYSFEGKNIAQGLDNTIEAIRSHPDLMKKIEAIIKEKHASTIS